MKMKDLILDYKKDELITWCKDNGQPGYRATQILEWLFRKSISEFNGMTNLPEGLRQKLSNLFCFFGTDPIKIQEDKDGTRKFLFQLRDSHHIETVYLPRRNDYTLCISTQVGCALGCRFCATGNMGIVRNISSGEILSQVLHVQKLLKTRQHGNIVFMGMGEPLLNADAVIKSVEMLTSDDGLGWSPRRITVSTAGIIPEIQRLGQLNLGINLAVSLNAADDKTRSRIMPLNRKYPIKELISVLREYPLPSRQHKITYEYIMIRNLNDSLANAEKLAHLLDNTRDKINLIPFNPVPGIKFRGSDRDTMLRFQDKLNSAGFSIHIRNSQGTGIRAACGQLACQESTDQEE